ncbi:FxsA family protein [Neisseria leonii]|uniref:FxsA family protein n=1 Tax=Neisseria leonii TaxID=2995413 RepID=A0A9X4E1V3_9NEIS|nr:FxsA family protein [Neisseria sp. 51.81]MDD9327963.1 FxsA family protein [Neisseria sp. 51.81]
MRFFAIGFLVLLFLEIMSIVWVAGWLGGGPTLLLMIAGFLVGLLMLRRFGLSGVLLAAAGARSGGRLSLYQLLWPVRYAVAAVMLMSPGFISTLLALFLMLPVKGRQAVRGGTAFQADSAHRTFTGRNREDIIEGEFTVERPGGQPENTGRTVGHRRG